MIGLKLYVPVLAAHIGVGASGLYQRQRKLMQAGVLVGSTGIGPGSGIRASAPAVSLLLASVLAVDGLPGIEDATRKTAQVVSDAGRCPLTGAANFGEALTLILASEATASAVTDIQVNRNTGRCTILYKAKGRIDASTFGRAKSKGLSNPLEVEVRLSGLALKTIAADLADIAAGKPLKDRF